MNEPFFALVDDYLDGEVSSEGHAELTSVLSHDARFLKAFVVESCLHHELHCALRRVNTQVISGESTLSGVSSGKSIVFWFAPWALRSTAAATMLVALLFYGSFAFLSWNLRPQQSPSHRWTSEIVQPQRASYVAILSEAKQCEWVSSGLAPSRGQSLPAGELELKAGVAEIAFNDGARVVLEGPARMSLESPHLGYLHHGKLVARVPHRAIGFTVETATATVVDLGTEFAMQVDQRGDTEVLVFEGKVALKPSKIGSHGQPPREFVLNAGMARKIEAGLPGQPVSILEAAWNRDRFVRRASGDSDANAAMTNSVAINRAVTGWVTSTDRDAVSAINDQIHGNQYDSSEGTTSAVALLFDRVESFNKIFLYHTAGFVIPGFEVQRAKTGIVSPDVNNDSDWETIPGGSFSGLSSNGQSTFIFSQSLTSRGVRILATDKSTAGLGNRMRIKELMVFDRYQNVAPQATVSTGADSWLAGTTAFNDELISDQTYINFSAPRIVDFTWPTPQTIGSFMLFGGSAAASEVLKDFTIQADLGEGLETLFTHTGNTSKVTNDILKRAITTTHVRLTITSADPDNLARVSEFFIFAPCDPVRLQER